MHALKISSRVQKMFKENCHNLVVHEHDQKAAILWNSFKERLGKSECTVMNFNIDHLATPEHLHDLELPFTKEEIDEIIKHMPSDKSPDPDGFNGTFM